MTTPTARFLQSLAPVLSAVNQVDPNALVQWRTGANGSYPEVHRAYRTETIKGRRADQILLTRVTLTGSDPTAFPLTVGDTLYLLDRLAYRGRPEEAKTLAENLILIGVDHWLPLLVVLAAHGCGNGRLTDPDLLLRDYTRSLSELPEERRYYVCKTAAAITGQPAAIAFHKGAEETLGFLFRLWKCTDPAYEHRFSSSVSERTAASVPCPYPDAVVSETGRMLMISQQLYYPTEPGSRPADVGPRVVQAFKNIGWRTGFSPLSGLRDAKRLKKRLQAALTEIAARPPDLVIVEELRDGLVEPGYAQHWIKEVRLRAPRCRIITLLSDPWSRNWWSRYRRIAPLVDGVWSVMAGLPLWDHPVFKGKYIAAMLPLGVTPPAIPDRPLPPSEFRFKGAVSFYNWPRAFWLTEARCAGIPIRMDHSDHADDGVSALDSYRAYLGALNHNGASLNFSIRLDGTRTGTGRSFESLAAGALLIQEATPCLAPYLCAGKHYVEFDTLGELKAIWDWLQRAPAEAAAVRDAGHRHYQDELSDEKLLRHVISSVSRNAANVRKPEHK